MNDEYAWLKSHHTQMRRYLRMLADSKADGKASQNTLNGLRKWVHILRSNASNEITRIRNHRN